MGGKGARTRFERFLPKPPASYPAGLVLSSKASAPSPPPLNASEPGAALGHFQGPLDPHPHPQGAQLQATPAAVAAAPTWNVCHVVLELPGEKRVPRLKASPIPAGAWVPQGVWPLRGLPFSKPGPGGGGVWAGTPCVVLFREQEAPERVFFPTRDRKFQP